MICFSQQAVNKSSGNTTFENEISVHLFAWVQHPYQWPFAADIITLMT